MGHATGRYHVVHEQIAERAILVGVERPRTDGWTLEEDLEELERLAATAGMTVVGHVTQRLDAPNPRTFIGAGKAEEVANLAREVAATHVIVDEELTPSQQANLEKLLPSVTVIDRTALILDIFAQHATSREGKLQVELARLEYVLPRLRGMWGHLQAERLGGGRGTRFGAGESQLEADRRMTRKRIQDLKRELEGVARDRRTQRHARAASGLTRIALVGYTNAGKSTLLNALTGAEVLVADQLFATLDATTRRLELSDGRLVTVTDTVGFINKLPHGLVEAFKSTLDEVREADVQLHVVDASHPKAREQMAAVREVLAEIGALGRPTIVVYNKCDLLPPDERSRLAAANPHAVMVSAAHRQGIEDLLARIAREVARGERAMEVLVPFERGDLVDLAHQRGTVVSKEHGPDGVHMHVRVPADVAARLGPYEVGRTATDA